MIVNVEKALKAKLIAIILQSTHSQFSYTNEKLSSTLHNNTTYEYTDCQASSIHKHFIGWKMFKFASVGWKSIKLYNDNVQSRPTIFICCHLLNFNIHHFYTLSCCCYIQNYQCCCYYYFPYMY